MAHISDFKNFKKLLENNNLNYSNSESILEAKLIPGDKPANQNAVEIDFDTDKDLFELDEEVKNLAQLQKLKSDLSKSGVSNSTDRRYEGDLIDILLQGVWRSSPFAPGRDKKAFKSWFKENAPEEKWWNILDESTLWKGFQNYLLKTKARGISLVKIADPIDVSIKEDGNMYTIGRISRRTGPVKNTTKQSLSGYSNVVRYMNIWNFTNFANGHQDYYVLPKTGLANKDDKRDAKGKYVSLTGTSRVTKTKSPYLYSKSNTTVDAINIAKKGGDTKTVGAKAGGEGAMQLAYNNGVSDKDKSGVKIDSNHPLVKQEAKKILSLLTDNDYIDAMTLVSSASPVWDSANQTMELYKKEGKKIAGNSDPGDGNDYASNNAKLAYERGNILAMALKAALGDRLPGTMDISWKISTDEPGSGKHAKYTWNKANDPGKTFKTPAGSRASGGDKTREEGFISGKIFAYRLKFPSPTA
jgi:hypothetical protein